MKYYITGSTGFIGSRLANMLLEKNMEVCRLKRPYILYNDMAVKEEFTLIHCSAYGNHYDQLDLVKTIDANIYNGIKLVEFALKNNCKLFINLCTSSVFLKTKTYYSLTKEIFAKYINDLNNKNFVNVYPYSVYGEGEAHWRLIPTIINCLEKEQTMLLDEDAVHDWIYVDDFCQALLDGYTFIGSGRSCSNLKIVRILEKISGKKLNYIKSTKLRSYDNGEWVSPSSVKHRDIEKGLEIVYRKLCGK